MKGLQFVLYLSLVLATSLLLASAAAEVVQPFADMKHAYDKAREHTGDDVPPGAFWLESKHLEIKTASFTLRPLQYRLVPVVPLQRVGIMIKVSHSASTANGQIFAAVTRHVWNPTKYANDLEIVREIKPSGSVFFPIVEKEDSLLLFLYSNHPNDIKIIVTAKTIPLRQIQKLRSRMESKTTKISLKSENQMEASHDGSKAVYATGFTVPIERGQSVAKLCVWLRSESTQSAKLNLAFGDSIPGGGKAEVYLSKDVGPNGLCRCVTGASSPHEAIVYSDSVGEYLISSHYNLQTPSGCPQGKVKF